MIDGCGLKCAAEGEVLAQKLGIPNKAIFYFKIRIKKKIAAPIWRAPAQMLSVEQFESKIQLIQTSPYHFK